VLLGTKKGRVLFLSDTYEGSVHDKAIIDKEGWLFPSGIVLHQDAGFQGPAPQGVMVQMPQKKPGTKDLTVEQKLSNKKKASERVTIEHIIGRIKCNHQDLI
jgi:hypothetical protein